MARIKNRVVRTMIVLFFYTVNFFLIALHFAPFEEEYEQYPSSADYILAHYTQSVEEQKFHILSDLLFLNIFLYHYQNSVNLGAILGIVLITVELYASLKCLFSYRKLKKQKGN